MIRCHVRYPISCAFILALRIVPVDNNHGFRLMMNEDCKLIIIIIIIIINSLVSLFSPVVVSHLVRRVTQITTLNKIHRFHWLSSI